jgi:hypothetical protein
VTAGDRDHEQATEKSKDGETAALKGTSLDLQPDIS